ncbi:MAG: glycosyltransferase family 2 protein [Paraglaciecola polaris]|uniref:glycosyltransferase family 2 protein n=1 Tax=Paraglaciecola polaris TaxID=222814 RepID=UPI003002F896
MSQSIEVSIILPVFNAEPYLAQCIDSLLNQNFKKFELLIINDGSTDGSFNIIKQYAAMDNRVKVINHINNIGLINVLNQSVEHCCGQYIARMDADDWCEPERLQLQFEYLESHPKVGIVGSWIELFGEKNEIWHYRTSNSFIKSLLLFKTNGFPHNSVMLRKPLLERFKYNKNFKHIEDTELWLRIMFQTPQVEFANIPKVLTHYRIWPQQTSSLYLDEQNSGYQQLITNALSLIIEDLRPCDIESHFQLIEIDPASSHSVKSVGQWVQKLSWYYNQFQQDEFYVIAEKWLKYCLNVSRSKKQALELYQRFKPENMQFDFLVEVKF